MASLEDRVEALERTLHQHSTILGALINTTDEIKQQNRGHDRRLDAIERNQQQLLHFLTQQFEAMNRRFDEIVQRLDHPF